MLCLSSTGGRGTIGRFYCIANCLSKCAKDTHRVVNEKFVTKLAYVRRQIVKLPCSTRTSNFGRVMTSSIATFVGLPLVNCPTRAGSGFLEPRAWLGRSNQAQAFFELFKSASKAYWALLLIKLFLSPQNKHPFKTHQARKKARQECEILGSGNPKPEPYLLQAPIRALAFKLGWVPSPTLLDPTLFN